MSSLTRTTAAPLQDSIHDDIQHVKFHDVTNNNVGQHQLNQHDSFVSSSNSKIKKALQNTTSNNYIYQENSFLDFMKNDTISQLDGADDPDLIFDEDEGLFKPNSAQKKKKSTKPNVKDEENSSVRTPLEVYNDFLSDKLSSMNLTDEQKRTLVDKASQLVEVSPDCDCVKYGCQGEKKICLKK